MLTFLFLAACASSEAPPATDAAPSAAREAGNTSSESPPSTRVIRPSCDPRPADCPPSGLDPTTCLDHEDLFEPLVEDGRVIDATLDPVALARLELEPGRWHVRYPAPDGRCDDAVFVFDADAHLREATEPQRHDEASPTTGRVERGTWGLALEGGAQ